MRSSFDIPYASSTIAMQSDAIGIQVFSCLFVNVLTSRVTSEDDVALFVKSRRLYAVLFVRFLC